MDIKYSYGSSRGRKVWIDAHIKLNELNYYNIVIEINPIANISKINYIVNQSKGKDIFIDSLGIAEDKEIINGAIEYATDKGYIQNIIDRYKRA